MGPFLAWLQQLSPPDVETTAVVWKRSFTYLLVCIGGPVTFGITVAMILSAIEKVFGIKLSSKGGH
ncbi:MAG: hypothetical protein V2A73_17450 [Pseudomonadota bacterium]